MASSLITFGRHFIRLRYAAMHWKQLCWEVVKNTIVWFSMILAFSDSLLEVVPEHSAIYAYTHDLWEYVFDTPAILLCLLLLIAIIVLIIKWPRAKAVYKDDTSDLKVIVECCDLMHQTGLKVIHSVDTFDTALGSIISPRSLHGAFLQKAKQHGEDIDALIDEQLQLHAPASTDNDLPGRKDRYPLGTVCPIEMGGTQYALVSFTHLQADGSIAVKQREYTEFLKRMWTNLANPKIRQDEIDVAVMGNRFVDLPAEFSTEQKIDLMLQTFFMVAREKTCCHTLRVCVHTTNVTEVDFQNYATIIKHLAKRPML